MARKITNSDDIIDSRDVIERIEELTAEWVEATERDASEFLLSEDDWAVGLGEEGAHELVALLALAKQGEDYVADWAHGETLVHADYFEAYAQEYAGDIGAVDPQASWPLNRIDWEAAADDLLQDYTALVFDGVTYYAR